MEKRTPTTQKRIKFKLNTNAKLSLSHPIFCSCHVSHCGLNFNSLAHYNQMNDAPSVCEMSPDNLAGMCCLHTSHFDIFWNMEI